MSEHMSLALRAYQFLQTNEPMVRGETPLTILQELTHNPVCLMTRISEIIVDNDGAVTDDGDELLADIIMLT